MPRPAGGDECSDFKNPIGRPAKAGLSGNRISRQGGKPKDEEMSADLGVTH